MLKLVVGVVIEILVAVLLAGLILGLTIPLLNRTDLVGPANLTVRTIIIGVLVGAVALALLRPGSAIRRYIQR